MARSDEMRKAMREARRDMLIQLCFLPPIVAAVLYLDGRTRIVTIVLCVLASYLAIDAANGRLGRPVNPRAITYSVVSNSILVGLMATGMLLGMSVLD